MRRRMLKVNEMGTRTMDEFSKLGSGAIELAADAQANISSTTTQATSVVTQQDAESKLQSARMSSRSSMDTNDLSREMSKNELIAMSQQQEFLMNAGIVKSRANAIVANNMELQSVATSAARDSQMAQAYTAGRVADYADRTGDHMDRAYSSIKAQTDSAILDATGSVDTSYHKASSSVIEASRQVQTDLDSMGMQTNAAVHDYGDVQLRRASDRSQSTVEGIIQLTQPLQQQVQDYMESYEYVYIYIHGVCVCVVYA